MELVQIYLHLGNDGSEFAQLQIYQMLIRNMKIRDYAKVVSEKFTEEELEGQIINCVRYMRNNCQLSGSQTLFSQSEGESKSQTESTQKSSVVLPKKNALKRVKRRIISNNRRDSNSSDSYDESEVNKNRAQHAKNGGPGLFDLIRRRKSKNIKPNNEEIIHTIDPADWASQPQQTDDRVAEPESLPALEYAPKPIPSFEIMKTQDNSFESNKENDSKVKQTQEIATHNSLNNSKIPAPQPSSSDSETDSERDEILKKTTSAETNIQSTPSEIANPECCTESETVLQATKSSDLNTPEKDSSKHTNPQKPDQQDRTPSKPAAKSLTPKKLLDDHLFNTDTADTESESGLRKEISSVADKILNSEKSPKNGKSNKKKVQLKDSEPEKEEESTSSAKLLARNAARKGTHDPTKVTAAVRSKASTAKVHTKAILCKVQTDSTDSDSTSDSGAVKTQVSSADAAVIKWKALNGPASKTQLPQTLPKTTSEKGKDFPFTSSDSSTGELVIDETHTRTKKQEKTSPAKAAKQFEKQSNSKAKEASSDSSSSDDSIFEKLSEQRRRSKASSVNESTHSARPKSASSDSDSDQFR